MKTILVEFGQTVEDIALIHYGDVAGVIDVLADNDLGVDDLLYAGQPLLIQDSIPELTDNNYATQKALILQGITPMSSMGGETPDELYMADDYVDDDYVE